MGLAASIISLFAKRSIKVDARMLGELTVSMLKGEHGHQRKELDKLIEWLRDAAGARRHQPAVHAADRPRGAAARAFGVPICCTLQGEDLFLDQLHEPYKTKRCG